MKGPEGKKRGREKKKTCSAGAGAGTWDTPRAGRGSVVVRHSVCFDK